MGIKIYTKTGDKGETSLYGGKRIPKYAPRVEAYGTVDELNAVIGMVIAEIQLSRKMSLLKKELAIIPHDLYDIGALLATPKETPVIKGKTIHEKLPKYLTERVSTMEHAIDLLTEKLPPIQAFILPGGGKSGGLLHQARTVCRRAERRIVELAQKEYIPGEVLIYMNRLSDLLFTMARFANYKEKKKEIFWNKKQLF